MEWPIGYSGMRVHLNKIFWKHLRPPEGMLPYNSDISSILILRVISRSEISKFPEEISWKCSRLSLQWCYLPALLTEPWVQVIGSSWWLLSLQLYHLHTWNFVRFITIIFCYKEPVWYCKVANSDVSKSVISSWTFLDLPYLKIFRHPWM